MLEKHFVRQFNEAEIQTVDPCLGGGSFGYVWVGKLDERKVAIKTHRQRIELPEGHDPEEAIKEIEILAGIKHKNVVHFYGSFQNDQGINIIFELLQHENLSKFVQNVQPDEILLNIAYDIACGLDYLHHMNILHMDLAARNIILDSNNRAKISDFGLSKKITPPEYRHVGLPLNNGQYYRWMPKESLPIYKRNGYFSKSSEVWSFGVTLWEMWKGGDRPYENLKTIDDVSAAILGRKNPISYDNHNWKIFPPKLRKLIATRIFVEEEFRLSFAQIKIMIQKMLTNSQLNGLNMGINEEPMEIGTCSI